MQTEISMKQVCSFTLQEWNSTSRLSDSNAPLSKREREELDRREEEEFQKMCCTEAEIAKQFCETIMRKEEIFYSRESKSMYSVRLKVQIQ